MRPRTGASPARTSLRHNMDTGRGDIFSEISRRKTFIIITERPRYIII